MTSVRESASAARYCAAQPPHTAGRKVVLIVLIFDISSHFHRICCGKAVVHMYVHVCTHRTTHTFLLQKHTDNLYLCLQTLAVFPHKYMNSMQTHTWSATRVRARSRSCACVFNHPES